MDTLTQVHLASQYLATAGKSFLEPKSDDSHTNVGFFTEDNTLRTWELDETGVYLAFEYTNFSLKWVSKDKSQVLALKGKSHGEIVEWISKMASESKLEKPYTYDLHYDLPYSITDDFTFGLSNPEELQGLIHLRTISQNTLKTFLQNENLESDIRIWPHHFDTGAFVTLNDGSGKSIGMGMAIPDSMVNDHYFYISGYQGHDGLDTSTFQNLTHGEWKNNGFKGGILGASNVVENIIVQFFQEAFKAYTS
ncbi:hypothetical protein [Flagellimonas sp. S3867]|uniref:hypothetical protein n=1 Tax=Flagellimonas sp. S3867 TaxID=2768063 RepID=UPI0016866F0F|nr:hypothetical protein [Flagellimonas sp. S3867]